MAARRQDYRARLPTETIIKNYVENYWKIPAGSIRAKLLRERKHLLAAPFVK